MVVLRSSINQFRNFVKPSVNSGLMLSLPKHQVDNQKNNLSAKRSVVFLELIDKK
jgi:hypothetical protein